MKFSSMRNRISYLISLALTAFLASGAFAQGVLAPHANAAVPEADGSCSVSAERISVAPVACKTVAQREQGGYHATPLSLIESPLRCLAIRRYMKFPSVASGGGIQ